MHRHRHRHLHLRIVSAVSLLLFSLLAVVVGVMTDVHDRSFPERLDASSNLYLDFGRSGLSDQQAFQVLRDAAARRDVRLVKVQPDLTGDQSGQNLVVLGSTAGLPRTVEWYGGQAPARVRDASALRHSFASGQYLVAGDRAGLDALVADLGASGVRVEREDDNVGQTVGFVLRQPSVRATVVAAAGLMVAMALFWLAVRARSRALRVLGGVPTARIQAQDLGAFLVAVVAASVPVTAVATTAVGVRHGWVHVPYYVGTLAACVVVLVGLTAVAATAMSLVTWPTARMLATRQPAVRSLRTTSGVLQVLTFVLVVAAAGPAWSAQRDASAAAAQQAQWKALADQVALRYPSALGEEGFQAVLPDVGAVVRDASRQDRAALSYAMTPEQMGLEDFGPHSVVAVVDRRWLTLMLGSAESRAVERVSLAEVPPTVRSALVPNLEIWSRDDDASGEEVLGSLTFLRGTGEGEVPLAEGGSGNLVFADDALLVVVEDPVSTFDDDFLASLTSSNNLVLEGVEPTLRLLAAHGLDRTLEVKLVAEDGVLRAQFAAYQAWLRLAALVGLLMAFALASAVSAVIAALLAARRDFPLRLDGRTWYAVLRSRVAREWLVGGTLAAAVVLTRPADTVAAVAGTALLALAVAPVSHLLAARWCFAGISLRRL